MANAIAPEVALAAVASMNQKIDAVMEKLATTPADQRNVITIPAVTEGRGPDGATTDARAEPTPQPAIGPPPPDVTFVGIRASERTDEEVFARVRAFLDPTQMGPLFRSQPIRRRVYFAKYPSFAEILSTEKILGPAPKSGGDEDIEAMWKMAGELGVTVLGSLAEHDPGIEHILANPAKPSEWPPLRRFSLANNRDPYLIADVLALWKQYFIWKTDVTPTGDEMEKYWGLNS